MKQSASYISNLTPLRGFAALVVVIFHFEELIGRFVNATNTMFLRKGYMMVDLFFVMSGFIIYHVYGSFFQNRFTTNSFKKFVVARFARIYPLHFAMLLLCILLMFAPTDDPTVKRVFDPSAIPTHIFLLHSFGLHKIYTFNIPSWSISAEWWSYMVFPLIVLLLCRKKWITIICSIVFVVAAYLSIMFLLPRTNPLDASIPVPHNLDVTYDYGFLRGLAGFLFGVLVYQLYLSDHLKRFFRKDFVSVICFLLAIAGMHFGINDGLQVLLFALLILAFACNESYVTKVCNTKIPQYLGEISYSIYMTQLIPLYFIPGIVSALGISIPQTSPYTFSFFTGGTYCFVIVILCIAVSSFFYHKVEMPCRKWINNKWATKKKSETVISVNLVANEHATLDASNEQLPHLDEN